jgi:hypothetical protein
MNENKIAIRKYMVVDKESGEIVADDAMFIGRKAFVDKGFRKVFVGFLKDIVINEKIAGKAIRLLLWIIENLKANDLKIYISPRIVCEELNITERTYYNWIKTLIEEQIVEKIDTNLYKLVPFTAVNGQMEKAIEKSIKKGQ